MAITHNSKRPSRRLCEIDAPDFARPVRVFLRLMDSAEGKSAVLEFRPLMSRTPVQVSLETLCRRVLLEAGVLGEARFSGRLLLASEDPRQMVIPEVRAMVAAETPGQSLRAEVLP